MNKNAKSKSVIRRVMRHLVIDLDLIVEVPPLPLPVRTVGAKDADALAQLMADAYRDSVDPEWADYEVALREILRIFTAIDGPVAPRACLAAFDEGRPVSACLTRSSRGKGCISYLMTASSHKNRGLGRGLLLRSLAALKDMGVAKAFLDVTRGNAHAEHLYESLGFIEEWSLQL